MGILKFRRLFSTLALFSCFFVVFAIGQAPNDLKPKEKQEEIWPLPDLPYAGSPYVAVQVAHLDSLRIPEPESYYFRYMWLPYEKKYLPKAYVLIKYHANRLSRAGKFGEIHLVTQDVVRIDTRDFAWDKNLDIWEKFSKIDYVFHQKAKLLQDSYVEEVWPGGISSIDGEFYERGVYKEVHKTKNTLIDIPSRRLPQREYNSLRHRLLTESPILMANWWFAQTVRQVSLRNTDDGVGYYNWLGIKDRNSFFDLCGVNEKVAFERFMEYRGVIRKSGISAQARQVGKLGAVVHGSVYFTLDTFKQQGRGQPLRNLRKGEFQHNAEEWYGFNSVGLDVNGLFDNNGKLQATAPDQVGPDDSALRVGKDARVHVNLSCVRCHGANKDMLQPLDEAIRDMFTWTSPFRLQDPNKKVIDELESQYLRDINEHLSDDRIKYARAIARCTATHFRPQGLTCQEVTTLYGGAWNDYAEYYVTTEVAARELGVTPEHLVNSIYRYTKGRGGADLIISQFLKYPHGKLTRLEWEDSYAFVADICHGIHPQDILEEVKRFDVKKKEEKKEPKVDKKPEKEDNK